MKHLLTALLALVSLFALSAPSQASGLVQLTLSGSMDQSGGARVELSVEAGGSDMSFRGHLARDTRCVDLAALFKRRLEAAGMRVTLGPDASPRGPVNLFIEEVEALTLRLGGGLVGHVTCVEEVPTRLRLLPPRTSEGPKGGELLVFVTSEAPAGDKDVRSELTVELPSGGATSAWVSDSLSRKAMASSMRSSRPTPDSWTTGGTNAGARAVGMSIELHSDADWALELRFPPLVNPR